LRSASQVMSRFRRLLKPALSVLVVLCVAWFFSKAFQRNWAEVRAHEFQLSVPFLVGSALATLAAMLLATYAWYTSINTLSASKVDFRQSVAAANVSGLTKYIPGKVWSYALQMYWLDGLGISKALVVYVGVLNLAISMGVSVIFALVCLLFSSVAFSASILLASLLALLAFDALSIWFNRALLHALVALVNRVFKRNLSAFDVTKALLLELHSIHAAAAVLSGLAAYLFCFAIGYRIDFDRSLIVIGSSTLGDVVGFLAIIVPGGLGVREGLMYKILEGQATGSLALVLPVASRLLNMFVEIALGLVALRLLRTLSVRKPSTTA
jgi:uncharacterized membrane protein YbhN (UPF0104 family)